MTTIADTARLIRSKNAGPFELTFDIMFDERDEYERAKRSGHFTSELLGALFGLAADRVRVFFCERAMAIKVSIPRPYPQGDIRDSDGHGGQQYAPLMSLELAED